MQKQINPALRDEITRAFDVAKQTVSLLYSRMDIAEIPNGGMALILRELILQQQEAVKYMAGE